MFENFKKITAFFCAAVLLLGIWAVNVSAAASATIAFSNQKPSVGQKVTVSVTVNGGEAMYNATFDLSYNPDVLKYESSNTTVNAGAGIVKASPAPGGKDKETYTFTFSGIAAGSATISVSGTAYGVDNDLPFGASAALTVTDAAKSDNANLKSLSLSVGKLEPSFAASRTKYNVSVANNVTECKVFAAAADAGAKIEILGKNALAVGKNTRSVVVTAPSGKQKEYSITITRAEEGEDESSSEPEKALNEAVIDGVTYTVLTDISDVTLPTGFSADTTEYNGTQVAVARDKSGNYTVYFLKSADSESYILYTISEKGNKFEKLKYAAFGDKTYIFADIPDGYTAPDGYYETEVKIGEFDVTAYTAADSEYTDFYYVYCFYNGKFDTYRYDSAENVLQRCPEFRLVKADEKQPEKTGFLSRFSSLSANAKTVVIGMAAAFIAAVVLIVLLIVKLFGKNGIPDEDDEDVMFSGDFDNAVVSDAGVKDEEPEKEPDDAGNEEK